MLINWAEHEREALKLYIEEGRTAEDTIECLNQQYDIAITIRQFKTKFGGLKKLRADEWREVGKELRKREEQGNTCDVYICGRRQDPFRVKRALRHSRSSQSSSTTSIDWNFEVCGLRRVEIRTLSSQDSTQSENEILCHAPVISEDPGLLLIPEGSPPLGQGTGISLGDFGVDMDGIELDFGTPKLDHHFFADLPSSPSCLGSIAASTFQRDSLVTSCQDATVTSHTSHRNSHNEPLSLPTIVKPSITASPTNRSYVPTSTIKMMHEFGGSSSQPWDILGTNLSFPDPPGLNSIDAKLGLSAIDWDEFKTKVPRGKAGWLESQLLSSDLTIKNLKPIANFLENILQSRSDNKIHFDGNVHEPLEQMFSVVTHLVSNQLLNGEPLFNFIEWVLESGFLGGLQTFLGKRPRNASNFIQEVLATISDDADWKTYKQEDGLLDLWNYFIEEHSSETISLIKAADSRTLSGTLGGKLLIHAAQFNNLRVAKLLVDRGANVDSQCTSNLSNCFQQRRRIKGLSIYKRTPLIGAIRGGSTEMLNYLLESGADFNLRVSEDHLHGKSSALAEAVREGNLNMVKILLQRGAKLYGDLMIGSWSIHKHAKRNSPAIFQLLEEALDRKLDPRGTPDLLLLIEAAEKGNHSLTEFLLRHHIVQNEVLEAGLCYAVRSQNACAARTFLHRGIDPNALRYRLSTLSGKLNEDSDEVSDEDSDEGSDEDSDEDSGDGSGEDFDNGHPLVRAASGVGDDVGADLVYLLAGAGASVSEGAVSRVCRNIRRAYKPKTFAAMVHARLNVALAGPSALEACPPDYSIVTWGYLLDVGVDINAYGAGGKSALQAAAVGKPCMNHFGSNLALVQYLLDRGADVNLSASDGRKGDDEKRQWRLTALQAAALGGVGEVVDCLLEAGADVRAPPAKLAGFTVLEAAAFATIGKYQYARSLKERIETFRKLFARGASVDRTDGTDCNVLHYLIRASQIQFLKEVLDTGAELEGRERNFHGSMTPIQVAAACHNIDAIQLLLNHDAEIDAPASTHRFGRTALQAAADPNHYCDGHDTYEVLSLLLRHGADVNAPAGNYFGRTALQAVTSRREPSAKDVALLLHNGANVNSPPADVGGVTALQGVAASGDIQIARMLLSYGADVNAPAARREGRTAIEAAAEYGRLDMVWLLLNEGAMPNANAGWSTAIELADGSSYFEISDILREHQRMCNTNHPSLIGQPSRNPGLLPTSGVILAKDGDYSMLL